jgi:excisionase family DNA binding protein
VLGRNKVPEMIAPNIASRDRRLEPLKQPPPELLKKADVAAALNIGLSQVHTLIASGRLPAISLGPKTIRVRRTDLHALLHEGRV